LGRQHSGIAGDSFPGFDRLDGWRFLERIEQDLAVHVFAGGEAEQGENGWTNIEETGSEDLFVDAQRRTFGAKDAKMTMLEGGTGGLGGKVQGPEMNGLKTVIAQDDHGGLGGGENPHGAPHR